MNELDPIMEEPLCERDIYGPWCVPVRLEYGYQVYNRISRALCWGGHFCDDRFLGMSERLLEL